MSTSQGNTLATIDLRLAVDILPTHSTLTVGTIQVDFNERGSVLPFALALYYPKRML